MTKMRMSWAWAWFLGVVLLANTVSAQSFVRLATKSGEGTLSPSVSSFEIDSKDVGAFGTVTLQPQDSYTGVWEVQCAVDGENYDTDSELLIKAKDSTSTPVTSVTNTVAVYDVLNAVGCKKIKVIVVSGFAATDTTMKWTASQVGGTSSGGGGGAGTSDTTETTQLAVLAAVDGIETLLGTANTSLAIIDNIVFGAGTAAAAQRVTFASDAPAVTVTDGAGALNVICDSGCAGSGTLGTQDTTLGTITSVTGGLQFGRASAAAPTSVSADDDAVLAWYLRNGAQATVITAAGALIGGDATNGLDVDVTRMAALVAGNANIGDVDIASIAAGNNNIGDVDVASLPSALLITSTLADNLALTQDVVAVFAINGCYDEAGGNVDLCRASNAEAAQAATAPANGIQGGLFYRSDLTGTAGVSNGQLARSLGDDLGRAMGGLVCTAGNIIDGQQDITDGSSTAITGVGAGGSNVVNEIWEVDINNSSATQVYVDLRDGTGGNVLRSFPVPASSGISRSLKVPIRTSANTALAADPSAAATTIHVAVAGCTTR